MNRPNNDGAGRFHHQHSARRPLPPMANPGRGPHPGRGPPMMMRGGPPMMNGGRMVPGRGAPRMNGGGGGGPPPPPPNMIMGGGRQGRGPPPPPHRIPGPPMPIQQQQQQQQHMHHHQYINHPQARGPVPPPPPPPSNRNIPGPPPPPPPPNMMQQQHHMNHQGRGIMPMQNTMYPTSGVVPPPPPPSNHQMQQHQHLVQRFPPQQQQQPPVGGRLGTHLPPPQPPFFQNSAPISQLPPQGLPPAAASNAGSAAPLVLPSTNAPTDPRRQQQFRGNSSGPAAASTIVNALAAGRGGSGAASQPASNAAVTRPTVPPNTAAAAAAAAAPSSYTTEQVDQAWITFKPQDGGTVYYHNPILKVSQYEKPEAVQRKEAPAVVATVNNTTTTQSRQTSEWREYTDSKTGKKYYSNGVATTWEKPAALGNAASETAAAAAAKDAEDVSSSEPPKKKKKVAKRDTEFGSKEEAVAAFKGLMLAKEILPATKWNDVIKLCKSDPRWQACEDVLSVGERKQSLAEYQTKRANDLRTIDRQEKARAKEAFIQLLTDKLPVLASFSAWTSRFEDVRDSLSKDDRFHAVATEATRESLFLDFCEEFKKREERKKRNKKREAKDSFVAFLKEKEEAGTLSFASTWNFFLSSLNDDEKSDSRFTTSAVMSDSDRQLYFADFVIDLQTMEDDKRNRIRGARRRAEKAQREAFQEALHGLAADGKISPSSKWRTSEDLIAALDSFGPVQDQDRDAPREIFEDFLAEWNENYGRDRSVLRQLVYPKSNKQLVVTVNTKYEEFTKALLEAAVDYPDLGGKARRIIHRSEPVSSARVYLQELLANAKELNGSVMARRGSNSRRLKDNDSSSEDEGEIVEDEEGKDAS